MAESIKKWHVAYKPKEQSAYDPLPNAAWYISSFASPEEALLFQRDITKDGGVLGLMFLKSGSIRAEFTEY